MEVAPCQMNMLTIVKKPYRSMHRKIPNQNNRAQTHVSEGMSVTRFIHRLGGEQNPARLDDTGV